MSLYTHYTGLLMEKGPQAKRVTQEDAQQVVAMIISQVYSPIDTLCKARPGLLAHEALRQALQNGCHEIELVVNPPESNVNLRR